MNEYVNDFTNTVQIYYDELKKYKPLSKSKERELLIMAKNGDLKAQNKILSANLRFVFDIAKRYKGSGVSIDDLIAEGNLGMIKAIKKFNMDYDVKFFSYAVWWIRQFMQAFIKKSQRQKNIEKKEEECISSLAKSCLIKDNEDEVVKKCETIMSNEEDEFNKELKEAQNTVVEKLLVSLNEREKVIIENYYGLNGNKEKNLEEIGKDLNISKERVRQIKAKSLVKMRSEVLMMDNVDFLFK